jgi:putative ABC transport system permease protein
MMIRPRWQKVLTDLWGNLNRTSLVVASISVGLFTIGIIATLYVVILNDMRTGYINVNPASIFIQTSLVNDDLVHHISNMSGVKEAQGVRYFSLRIKNAKGTWQAIDIKAYHNLEALEINKPRLKEGRWPKDGEIALDENRLVELSAKLGDKIELELPSEKKRELTLVGVVQDQTIGAYGNGGGFFVAAMQGYVAQDTLDKLEQTSIDNFNGVYITVTQKGTDLDYVKGVADEINKNLKNNGVKVYASKVVSSEAHPNASLVDAISGILIVLGALSVFLSGFLVTNTLQALLKQQTQQIGIMKSIGARQIQIVMVYAALILTFGALSFLVATPLAYLFAFKLLEFLGGKLNFVLSSWRFEPVVVLIQAALAVSMPLLAAWQPIWDGSKVSVTEALSGGLTSEHKKKVPKGKRQKRFDPMSWLSKAALPLAISVRNTFRHKNRLLLTLFTLSLGGAIFIATFNVRLSLDQYINQIKQYFTADVNLVLERPYRNTEIEQILARVPGVGRVEAWTSARTELKSKEGVVGDRVQLIAPPADSTIIKPVIMEGRWVRTGDTKAIILSDGFKLRHPELKVGSTLDLRVNDKDTQWEVIGFFQLAGKLSGYTAYTNYDYLVELTNKPFQVSNFQIVSSKKNLTLAEQDHLKSAIEAELNAEDIKIANLTTGQSDSSSTSGGLSTLTIFLLFMAVLIAIVGSIGLAGTMSMNVMERTREIGILRSVGASDRVLMRMVLVEGLTIGMISYALAVLLSFPITKVMGDSMIQAIFGMPATMVVTSTGFIIWLIMVVTLSVLASLIPARSAAQLTIREVLSYE